MTIWTYNLVTYEIKEVEVDEVRSPSLAVKKRPSTGKLKEGANNITYNRFALSQKYAEEIVRDALRTEILKRLKRLDPIIRRHNELESNSFNRFTTQPIPII